MASSNRTRSNSARHTSVEERFWAKVDRRGPDECWPWLGGKTPSGYGRFWNRGKLTRAHRYSYERARGPIPSGMNIDHTCHTRAVEQGLCKGGKSCPHRTCVNPRHLEAVTCRTNVLRGLSATAVNARKTHCIRGHEFTPENTFVAHSRGSGGGRKCKACDYALGKKIRARRSKATNQ